MVKHNQIKAIEKVDRENDANHNDKCYNELSQEKRNDTSPLLLDSVDIPIVEPLCTCNHILTTQCKKLIQSARRERDDALMIARHAV